MIIWELKRIQKTGVEPNGASIKPRLSPDGRYIVFESKATNLIDGDVVDSHSDIFLFDTTTQNIEKVVGFLSSAPNQNSHTPTVSRDGKHVLFASEATNLVAGDTNGVSDLFLVNRAGQSIQRVSLGSGGGQLNGASQNGMIDDFGNKIVFESFSNLQGGVEIQSQVFFFDALTNATSLLSQKEGNLGDGHSINAKLSSGGRVVIFESEAKNLSLGGRNRFKNIFSYDLQSQEVKLISATDQGLNLNANSFGASISGNGRYVSYITRATNLSSDTENCVARPVVRDLLTNKQVSLYSRIGNDCKAGAISTALSFSGDSISVSSKTSDLVEGDTNNFEDVFLFGNPLRVAGLVKSSKNWSKLISQRSVK